MKKSPLKNLPFIATLLLSIIFALLYFFAANQFNVNISLTVIALILTILSGFDFIRNITSFERPNKPPVDLLLVFSVAVAITSIISLVCKVDESILELREQVTIIGTLILLVLGMIASAYLKHKHGTKSKVRRIEKESHSIFNENNETITIITTIKKAP
ncbi:MULTISPECIES: hypothetical protein [Klebsiella]|uniref:hypothetical protein n=1 Tax=Klebsiella TaxID=570 RepID=UPI001144261E|nr:MULTISPECIES: hypothetical protein [Klebsiella]TYY42196.1 hypothetical protein FCH00_025465 [Klebsiella pneumoniae]HBQ7650764.1 hypothetical protein [Klebsiella pneumoniae]HBS6576996.1 hypothetical protein [Klebsiella pneumoniae]HBV9908951.1 hypothetical protein [Klebsiella aerogenes]